MSTTSTVRVEHKKGIAIAYMENGKVNAIDNQFLKDIKAAVTSLDKDDSVKAMILTGKPHCFSAGLDVRSLAETDPDKVREFWTNFYETLRAMVHFSKPLIAAISGYAPAGGTMLALCSDYRIMGKGPKHVLGLHEFKMSILVPEMMADIYSYYLGEHRAWKFIQEAKLMNSDEALELGLIDESVEVEEVLERAEKMAKKLTNIYPATYRITKSYVRKQLHKIVDVDITAKVEEIVKGMQDPQLQQLIQMFLMSLASKNKK